MKKRYVIGMGTGRTGSASFATFMHSQKHTTFGHEIMDLTFWPIFKSYSRAMKQINSFGSKFVGDVSPGWCAWAHKVLDKDPMTKVIWLVRDLEEVADSFYKQKQKSPEFMAEFYKHEHKYQGLYPIWDYAFSRDAILRAVTTVYWLAKSVATFYPERVWVMRTENLSDQGKQEEMLDWLGYKKKDMRLGMPHINRSS